MNETGLKRHPWYWLLKAVAVILSVSLLLSIISPSVTRFVNAAPEGTQEDITEPVETEDADTAVSFAQYYQMADAAINEGNYALAEEYLQQAKSYAAGESESVYAELLLKSASVSILTGNTEQARQLLEEALELESDSAQALLLSAQLAIDRGSNQEAIGYLSQYTELVPTDVDAGVALAGLQELVGDYASARVQYEALYTLQPEDASHWLNAVRCQFLSGQQDEALEAFTRFLAEEPDSDYYPTALFLRAASLMQVGSFDEAAEGFMQAQQCGYDAASCLTQLMLCSFEADSYLQAVAYGQELIEMNAEIDMPELFYQRMGASMVLLGRYEEAITYLDQAEQYAPHLSGNAYYYGVALLALERYEEAVTQFTASIDQDFLTQFCYYNRGVCYVQLLDYDKAYDDMRSTLISGEDTSLNEAANSIISQLDEYRQNEQAAQT